MEKVFDKFIDALEKDDSSLLDEVLADDVKLDSSAVGIHEGKEAVKEALKWKGLDVSFRKTRIFNEVHRTANGITYQSFYSCLMFGKESANFLNLFQTCFENRFDYKDGKIISIKCYMTYEHGNSLIVSDWWKMLDYTVNGGCDRKIIDGPKDSVWHLAPVCEENNSDEEEIHQQFCHYTWAVDTGLGDELRECCSKKVCFVSDPSKVAPGDVEKLVSSFSTKRFRSTSFNGVEYPREVCWNHIGTIKNIEVNGDTAKVVIYRYEANRIGTRFQHRHNLNTMYYSAHYTIGLIKEDGQWKQDTIVYTVDSPEQFDEPWERRYF